ncbi:MAG: hypothetical protein AAF206_20620, partial [Bacteroidota bacterium]
TQHQCYRHLMKNHILLFSSSHPEKAPNEETAMPESSHEHIHQISDSAEYHDLDHHDLTDAEIQMIAHKTMMSRNAYFSQSEYGS